MKLFHHSQLGAPRKEKKSGALGTCPVCPLVKTALSYMQSSQQSVPHTIVDVVVVVMCRVFSYHC